MSTRKELRDELEANLGAARSLTPDSDAHLVERFVTSLERDGVQPYRPRVLAYRPRKRLAAALLALTVLVGGGSFAVWAVAAPPSVRCEGGLVQIYPSMAAAKAEAHRMRSSGYLLTGSRQFLDGHAEMDYTKSGGCTG